MAEADVGSIRATLSIDSSGWTRSLQQAQQQLTQFGQTISRSMTPPAAAAQQQMHGLATAVGQVTTQMGQATRATSLWTQALSVAGGLGIVTSLQGAVSALQAFGSAIIETGTKFEAGFFGDLEKFRAPEHAALMQ